MHSLTDSTLRSLARRRGLMLRRSRGAVSPDNLGGYMLVDASTNAVVAGDRFDLEPVEVARFLAD